MESRVAHRIDVLMCVGPRDLDYLFPCSVQSCVSNFHFLNQLVIVTFSKTEVLKVVRQNQLDSICPNLKVIEDDEVIPAGLRSWPAWCKQQFIKLHADRICETPVIACLGADTIIFKRLLTTDLFSGTTPILFYNRYPHTDTHLKYERERVRNVAVVLQVEPVRSLPLGDFINDFMLFEALRLQQLRRYLQELYGPDAFQQILPKDAETLEQRVTFGEWTLYAVFLLDVLKTATPIRNSQNKFIAQIHSAKDFSNFDFDAHVVHFVDKSFDKDRILLALNSQCESNNVSKTD